MATNVELTVSGTGQGLYEVTREVNRVVEASGIEDGLATVFIRHTSASLVIQENADPTVLHDLETFLTRLVPEDPGLYRHTAEGEDDMPAHIRAALTQTHLSIPILNGRLGLGAWQGIFVWEHRQERPSRRLVVTVMGT